MALRAWTALVQYLHATYDNKVHATVLTQHKQVMQVVFKKVEKSVRQMSGALSVDERVQFQVAMKGVMVAAKLFPSSFKNILAGRQGVSKKDNVTAVLEGIVKVFLPMGQAGSTIVDMALQILCLLFKSRDKPRSAFREWL